MNNNNIREAALIGAEVHPILNDLLITNSEITIIDDSESLIKLVVSLIRQTPIVHDSDGEWSGKFNIEVDVSKNIRIYLDGVYYQYGIDELIGISADLDNCYFLNDGNEVEVKYDRCSSSPELTTNNSFKQLIEDSVIL